LVRLTQDEDADVEALSLFFKPRREVCSSFLTWSVVVTAAAAVVFGAAIIDPDD